MIRNYLNEHAPQLKQPLIVGLASLPMKEYEQQAMLAGMDIFHTKPIFASIVVKIIDKAQLLQHDDLIHD